uniref:Pre-protein VI n=1 Tax=Rhinolophus ferrumequinum adenovirus TaxID=3140013 RepID=A0AAU6S551_9ADEN
MDAVTFTSLAPRIGSRPMMSGWSEIGTSAMSGGAFSWGNVWSGLKSFGSKVKTYGTKAWNSTTAKQLRDKLKQTKFQEKVVDGLATGIHGAIDLARQKLDRELDKRLDRPIPIEEEDIQDVDGPLPIEKEVEIEKTPVPSAPEKRPSEKEEELVMTLDEPPSYDEIFGDKSGLQPTTYPMTRPVHPLARPVLPPPPAYEAPTPAPAPVVVPTSPVVKPAPVVVPTSPVVKPAPVVVPVARPVVTVRPGGRNWQNTLSSITGLGVRSIKRRRCW